jgi:hypothetical protein
MEFPAKHFSDILSDADEMHCYDIAKWFLSIHYYLKANPNNVDELLIHSCGCVANFCILLNDARNAESPEVAWDIDDYDPDYSKESMLKHIQNCKSLLLSLNQYLVLEELVDNQGNYLKDEYEQLKLNFLALENTMYRFDRIWFPEWRKLWFQEKKIKPYLCIPAAIVPEEENIYIVYEAMRQAIYALNKQYFLPTCDFCGADQEHCRKLIAGDRVYICNDCVDLCNDIIDDELEDSPQ